MNKKFSRILGVGLTVALLASLLLVAGPASAGTLKWDEEDPAKDLKARVDNILSVAGLDIVDLAVKGDVVYAATNNSSNPLYKSTNGGKSWSNLVSSTSFPQGVALKAVAVASSDANIVAIITTANEVVYSTKGGSSWNNLLVPGGATNTTMNDVDVAPVGDYIAVGGNSTASAAELYTMKLEIAEVWKTRASGNFTPGQATVNAVKFSPNFATDKIITVVSGNATSATFQLFRYETGAFTWNGQIAFLTYADWLQGVAIATVVGGVARADIALPSSFMGTDRDSRLAFVAVAGATSGGGVSRLSDNYKKDFQTWSAGDEGPIVSIAYHDSGKVLAGTGPTNNVYVGLTPMATTPSFERINTLKQPGGETRVIVAWSGTKVFAGTSGDESAFAVSTDNGYSFNDTSLIDTTLAAISDIAVSADGKTYYLTSNSTDMDVSVWVRDTAWTRVLSLKNQANESFIARVAPTDAKTIYVAAKGSQDMWVSKDSGKKDWKSIPAYSLGTGDTILDFVVQTADIVYVADNDGVTKTTNAGISWGTQKRPVDTFIPSMIALAPNNDVLVGGNDGGTSGLVAFSKDGGATFELTKAVVTSAPVTIQVAADWDYAKNGIIYAGAGVDVKRGKTDTTTEWSSRKPSATNGPGAIDATQAVTGLLADSANKIVYVLTANTTASALWRSLNLQTAGTDTTDVWSNKTSTSSYMAVPQALKLSKDKLWAIGTPNLVHSFDDPIAAATAAPTLTGPATGTRVRVNPGTGQAYNVTFTFKRQSTSVTMLELQIATDSAFTALVYNPGAFAVTSDTTAIVLGPTAATVVDFNPGSTYYWRVRTGVAGPVYSPWSRTNSFTVDGPVAFAVVSPAPGAEGVSTTPALVWNKFEGAIGYEVMVSMDPTFAILEFGHSTGVDTTFYKTQPEEALKYSTTYYWRARGVTGPAVKTAPAPGGPWQIGLFTTEAKPVEPTPPVVIQPPAAPEIKIVQVPVEKVVPQAIPSYLLWAIIVIGAVLVIALIVLIVRTRRVA